MVSPSNDHLPYHPSTWGSNPHYIECTDEDNRRNVLEKEKKKKKKVSSLIWGKQQTKRLMEEVKKNTYQDEVRFLLVRLKRRRFLDRGPSVSCSVFFVCIVSDFVF